MICAFEWFSIDISGEIVYRRTVVQYAVPIDLNRNGLVNVLKCWDRSLIIISDKHILFLDRDSHDENVKSAGDGHQKALEMQI